MHSAKQILVVFGVTGQQGGSVARAIYEHPVLSQRYTVRGVTRDPTSLPARELVDRFGCEVVRADLDNESSIKSAIAGATGIFLVTSSIYDDRLYEREVSQGKAVADAAVDANVQFIIFSTLPSVREISNGKYIHVAHFDAKYDIEQYIRSLRSLNSSFVSLGSFMQNLQNGLKPQPLGDGTFAINASMSADTRLPLVDATDVYKFILAILENPEEFRGKVIRVAERLYKLDEMATIISNATGKVVKYSQLPPDVVRSFLDPVMADDVMEMAAFFEEFGYFGPDMETLLQNEPNLGIDGMTTLVQFCLQMNLG